MKPLQTFISTCAVLLTASVAFAASLDIQDLLTEGQLAYQSGNLAKAKAAFTTVYKIDSRNQVAIGYLRRIQVDEASKPKGNDQEKQLSTLILPQLQFRDATLGSALEYFKKAVDRQSGGKQAINFVVQLPQEQVNTQTVTLNLTAIPVTEALRYLGDLANATFVYEKYAVIMKAKAPGGAPAPAPTAAQ